MVMHNPHYIFLINWIIKSISIVSEEDLAWEKNINFSLVFLQLSIG